MKQRVLSHTPGTFKIPAVISLLLVLPFMILELANRGDSLQHFPVPLFGFMWLLAVVFIVLLMPVLRSLKTGVGATSEVVRLLPRILLLILIAWMWTSVVLDQMPCFLGVPNCD